MTDIQQLAVPEFDGATIAFGAPSSSYLTREQMGDEFYADRNRFTRVASSLFFSGGSLAQHGLRFKPSIDKAKAMGAIRAWLCSFEPKHEVKIGTVGYALSQWCEDGEIDLAPPITPHQAQRKKKRKGGHRIRKAGAPQ